MGKPQNGTVRDLAHKLRQTRLQSGLAPVVFLIGAGCSVSAGVPTVPVIAKRQVVELARKYGDTNIADPTKALHFLGTRGILAGHKDIAERGDEKLVDWGQIYDALFKEVYSAPDEARDLFKSLIENAKPMMNWAHLALGELAAQNWISTTITTNFDLLALEGYARAGVIPVVSDGIESLDRIDPRPTHPQLLQINGSLHSYRLRNSASDLSEVGGSHAAIGTFETLFQNARVIVVVGYDGREPQIMKLLTDAAHRLPDKHIFWCLHSGNPDNLSPNAEEFLSYSRNARLIVGQDADLFFHELCQELEIGEPQSLRDPMEFLKLRLQGVFDPTHPRLAVIAAARSKAVALLAALQDGMDGKPAAPKTPGTRPGPRARARRREDTAEAEAKALIAEIDAAHIRDPFTALRDEQNRWNVSGRDKGLSFDLEVAIHLAGAARDRAVDADQRGKALIDLGVSLTNLGEREPASTHLEQAVAAYRAALEVHARDRMPLDWATTQNNLGNVLSTLGERESGTARLEQAVAAYQAALEERTRDRVPLAWAMTQNNLGYALTALGEREPGTARLVEAVAAFRAALEEQTRDRMPQGWALIQDNLGKTLRLIGEREPGTVRLKQAVEAFGAALEERTRDRVPLDWAATQYGLGIALRALGEREPGTARLEEAIAAQRAGLQERTRDRVPLDWAASLGNIGLAMTLLADRTDDLAMARQALQQLQEVEAVLRDGGQHHFASYATEGISSARAVIARLTAVGVEPDSPPAQTL